MGIVTLWIVGSVLHVRQTGNFIAELASPVHSSTQNQLNRLDQDLAAIANAVNFELARASSRSGSEVEDGSPSSLTTHLF